jgi:hypothetical protein
MSRLYVKFFFNIVYIKKMSAAGGDPSRGGAAAAGGGLTSGELARVARALELAEERSHIIDRELRGSHGWDRMDEKEQEDAIQLATYRNRVHAYNNAIKAKNAVVVPTRDLTNAVIDTRAYLDEFIITTLLPIDSLNSYIGHLLDYGTLDKEAKKHVKARIKSKAEKVQKMAQEEARRAAQEARRAEEVAKKAEEVAKKAEEDARRAEAIARRAQDVERKAEEEERKAHAVVKKTEDDEYNEHHAKGVKKVSTRAKRAKHAKHAKRVTRAKRAKKNMRRR